MVGELCPTISTSTFMVKKSCNNEQLIGLEHILSGRMVSEVDNEFYMIKEQ